MNTLIRILTACALSAVATIAAAQDAWPTRPLRVIVPFPPGAPNDLMVRMVAGDLQKALGQPVVVDNKPGASGNIGMSEVLRAADEHTVLAGVDTMLTVNPHLFRKLGFKPSEDFAVVTQMAAFSQMLVCHPKAGVSTLQELIAAARKAPMSYASGGAGVPGHLAMEMLLTASQVKMTHVPYRGPNPALQDLLGQVVPCGFLASPVVGPYVKDGKLVALAVSGATRLASHLGVPTVAEAGVPGYDATFTELVAVPKSTPAARVRKLRDAFAAALQTAEVKVRLAPLDLEVIANTPDDARRRVEADSVKWKGVIEKVGLQLD